MAQADHSRRVNNKNAMKRTVNSCMNWAEVNFQIQFFQPLLKRSKFPWLLLDPADWLWAAWNFWMQPLLDFQLNNASRWTKNTLNYRSPEFFHELVVSRSKTHQGRAMASRFN